MLRYLFFLLRLSSDPSYVDQAMNALHTYIHIVDCLYVISSLRILCMYEYRIYLDDIQAHNHMNVVMSVCMFVCMYVFM